MTTLHSTSRKPKNRATPIDANPSKSLAEVRCFIRNIAPNIDAVALRRAHATAAQTLALTSSVSPTLRSIKRESTRDFIAKKRDLILLQASIDTKRDEIAALQRRADDAEAAVTAEEAALISSDAAYDAALKRADDEAHEALRRADVASAAKAVQLLELKKVRYRVVQLKGHRGRLVDTLEELRGYQRFIESLTPRVWVASQSAARAAIRSAANAAARRSVFEKSMSEWTAHRAVIESEITACVDAKRRAARAAGRAYVQADVDTLVSAALPPPPVEAYDENLDGCVAAVSGTHPEAAGGGVYNDNNEGTEEEHMPLYFASPNDLLTLFTSMAEGNLFLIGHVSETEAALEDLRVRRSRLVAAAAAQSEELVAASAAQRHQIEAAERQFADVATMPVANGSQNNGLPVVTIDTRPTRRTARDEAALSLFLGAAIAGLYARAGFAPAAAADPLLMLGALEGRLESLLRSTSILDADFVASHERDKDQLRRAHARHARLAAEEAAHDARQRRMIERAQAPPATRRGKPIMTRSRLPSPQPPAPAPDAGRELRLEDARYF